MEREKDGRRWRIGGCDQVEWMAGEPAAGDTIATAIPPVFDAYATFYAPDDGQVREHERAVVEVLTAYTDEQPWWLGFLETGAHDVVFLDAPRVSLYWGWPYVLVEAGPEQALGWRLGHMRYSEGSLPDLFFPADRSWLVSALWDDIWTCIGGPEALIDRLECSALVNARRVTLDEDMLPPGLTREG
jgi:hypothetical protein